MDAQDRTDATSTRVDEDAVLAKARSGDRGAREQLCAQFRNVLVRFCFRYVGNTEDAEDLAQDVLARTFVAGRWPDGDTIRPWLFRIARNASLNRIREHKRGSAVATFFPASQLLDARTGPRTRVAGQELTARAAEVLSALPAHLAEVLTLRYMEDMSRSEIADVVGLSISGVKKRLVAARLEMARRLPERGGG